MDAKTFFEEAHRMCGEQAGCGDCPIKSKDDGCALKGIPIWAHDTKAIDEVIDAVEKWSQENPQKRGKQNMDENKHGFEPKQEFTMGGIAWTVIQTGADWVKCITSECVAEGAFDEGNKNDFAASSLRTYLNGEFLRRLIKAGAPEEMFEYFNIDLTADDGLKNYGGDRVRIGLITCEEYRLLRSNIPALPDRWWWTATPDSPINSFVRRVYSDGSLSDSSAYSGYVGVRPICKLKSELLTSYLKQGNPKKTRLADFLGKYPNAPIGKDGTPYSMPWNLGYCGNIVGCYACEKVESESARWCWEQEVEEE